MNRNYRKILRNRKYGIARRLAPKPWADQPRPMFKASNLHYEMSGRVNAVSCGGIGALHLMVQRLGLVEDINQNLKLLKVHLPYHESDHVLNIAYNLLAGGVRLEDIELRRQDENFLNGLSGKDAALPPRPPLRSERESFPSFGSSRCEASRERSRFARKISARP